MKINANPFVRNMLASVLMLASAVNVNGQRPIPAAYNPGVQVSYIRTWEATAPEQNADALIARPLKDVKQSQQYFDGLGRLVQTVIRQGSLQTGNNSTDIVSPVEYDDFGRELFKYIPYPEASANTGAFKLNPFQEQSNFMTAQYGGQGESWFYSQTILEAPVLNRPAKSLAPGNSWVGSNYGVSMQYLNNTTDDAVRIWDVTNVSGGFGTYTNASPYTYGAGKLTKTITIDEHGKQVIEFKDMEGRVILKKVQLAESPGTPDPHDGWLCTYYIYDNLGNLRCVVQPEGVKALIGSWTLNATLLEEQCFRYEYDQRNRMIKKKVPGAEEVWMVYDARDRLVMTQDANMRSSSQKKWMYNIYDQHNRLVVTGLITDLNHYNDHAYHLDGAYNSTTYPDLASYTTEELTRQFYDNYNWRPYFGNPLSDVYDASYNSYFQTSSNTIWPYPQANSQSAQLKEFITGTRVKVLGTSTYLYTVNFYDDKGRIIQVQSTNITGGTDITTTQYSWAGQPLVTVQKQEKAGTNAQTSVVVTQISYDDLGRILTVEKKLSNTGVSSGAMSNYKTILENEYDKLGQLKKKVISPTGSATGGHLEDLAYDYNIRGWMLGVNRDYLTTAGQSGSTRFGFELGYDKILNSSGRNFLAAKYNGNINGMVWKSDGDDVKRKYDFTYDAVNRLLKGLFEQDDAQNAWNSTTMNYAMQMGNGTDPTTAYDNNGNIKAMTQYGWKLGASSGTPIDNLTYNYMTSSNKLLNVIDYNNDPQTKLGDFRTSSLHPNSGNKNENTVDYTYDVNGNLKKDLNKDIGTATVEDIVYNHLNLPQSITVRTTGGAIKGTISYTYDAAGNKMKKEVAETGQPTKLTLYMGGSVYENDQLQFIMHEEGRIRLAPATTATCPAQPARFIYDYFIKDHLGNVRMVLTEQHESLCYPAATVENSRWVSEQQYYNIVDGRRIDKFVAGAPQSSFEDKLYRTHGGLTNEKTGLGMVLKVMAGDEVKIAAESYYTMPVGGPGPTTGVPALSELLSAFVGSNIVSGVHNGVTTTQVSSQGANSSTIQGYMQSQSEGSNNARAFVYWMLFDEQLKFVTGGADPVQPGGGYKLHSTFVNNPVSVNKNGFLYIYVINESNLAVYFDNLMITHTPGAILEETHYYPYGLVMKGISSQALDFGGRKNRYKYNRKEEQREEFSNGSGLEWLDYGARMYDNQIGRWMVIDPLCEKFETWSPFVYTYDNPISHTDPDGRSAEAVVNKKKQRVTIKANLIFYGDITRKEARQIKREINSMYNNANGKISIEGEDYSVKVKVKVSVKSQETAEKMAAKNSDIKNNFVRVNDNPTFWGKHSVTQTGSNSALWLQSDQLISSKTAAHEFGHLLGLGESHWDMRGKGQPGIMAARGTWVDAPFTLNPALGSTVPGLPPSNPVDPSKREVTQGNITEIFSKVTFSGGRANIGSLSNVIHNEDGTIKF